MVIAAIVAGGTGSRMESALPKQFLEIKGKPVILHTLEKFLNCKEIDHVMVGIHRDWTGYLEDLLRQYFSDIRNIVIVEGGADRHSTLNNLMEKAASLWAVDESTIFVTHDAVRPFVNEEMIRKNIEAADKYGICGTMIPATDTIVQSADGDFVSSMPVRAEMFQCQTPQSFRYGLYREVFDSMTPEELEAATDTCKLFFLRGLKVYMVKGDRSNFKITYPSDLKTAELYL